MKVISNFEFIAIGDRQKADEIMYLIENFDKPETYKDWCIYLNIFDRELQRDSSKSGVYWRKWLLSFESGILEIEVESKYTNNLGHYGDDFSCFGSVCFIKHLNCSKMYFNVDIQKVIDDVRNYKQYITETLNDIEVDIKF